MQDSAVVKDSQITAVSFWEFNNHDVYRSYHGRLFNKGSDGGSWIAGRHAFNTNSLFLENIFDKDFNHKPMLILLLDKLLLVILDDHNKWIQVDYVQSKTIYGVVTQGRNIDEHFVKSYNVLYNVEGNTQFKYILDGNGDKKVCFHSN